mgnify:CR=1 FL=1
MLWLSETLGGVMIPFATMTERFAVRSTIKMDSSKSSSRKNARGIKGI